MALCGTDGAGDRIPRGWLGPVRPDFNARWRVLNGVAERHRASDSAVGVRGRTLKVYGIGEAKFGECLNSTVGAGGGILSVRRTGERRS